MLTRRQFVAGSAAVLVGCKSSSRRDQSSSEAEGASEALDEAGFLALSRVLLHPAEPDPALAAAYLEALRVDERSYTLEELARHVGRGAMPAPDTPARGPARGSAADVDALYARMPDEARTLADEVISAWYTGVVSTAAGPVVVTWSGALAWRVIPSIHAPSECGAAPGAWARAPEGSRDG